MQANSVFLLPKREDNSILGFINRSVACKLREMILLFYLVLVKPHLGGLCPALDTILQESYVQLRKSPEKSDKNDEVAKKRDLG